MRMDPGEATALKPRPDLPRLTRLPPVLLIPYPDTAKVGAIIGRLDIAPRTVGLPTTRLYAHGEEDRRHATHDIFDRRDHL